jgi:hypothetical protein
VAISEVGRIQGDQIGHIFAHWVIAYFRTGFLKNSRSYQNFWAIVVYVLILTENELVNILAYF